MTEEQQVRLKEKIRELKVTNRDAYNVSCWGGAWYVQRKGAKRAARSGFATADEALEYARGLRKWSRIFVHRKDGVVERTIERD